MKPLVAGALAALMLTACAPSPGTVMPYQLSDSYKATIEATVRATLKDPDSARFGAMSATKDMTGSVSVCGWVNAKNSFGGYTGDQLFIGLLNDGARPAVFTLTAIDPQQPGQWPVLFKCKHAGIIPPHA
ncbi:MAG: hypothetical protein ACLQF1_05960 [Methyloceanibacter sp.]